ncbi:MAG: hypothetical protein IJC67_02640 [Clostridia bacterium]|nr:hypothetical protein [Clostridia bacterium]
MQELNVTATLVAPFGFYPDEILLSTARNFRSGLGEQGNRFEKLEMCILAAEGNSALCCDGTDYALNVAEETGLHSLQGTLMVRVQVEDAERAEQALDNAFERATAEKGVTMIARCDDDEDDE